MTTTAHRGELDALLVSAAAGAAADRLPTSTPLTPADPLPGSAQGATTFAGAVVADVVGHAQVRLGVLVAEDLVRALAESPVPGLSLAAAVQPAIDAAAATLGASAGEAREVDPAAVGPELGGEFTVVPLVGSGFSAAFVVSDALVSSAVAAAPAFSSDPQVHAPEPVPAPAPVAAPVVAPAVTTAATTYAPAPARRGLDLLHGVDMELTVELGRTRMAVRDLLSLAPGDVIELDRAAGAPADLLVNGRLIARGEVVVVDENFGLRITEILDAQAG